MMNDRSVAHCEVVRVKSLRLVIISDRGRRRSYNRRFVGTTKPMKAQTIFFLPPLSLIAMLAVLAHADSLPYPETPKNPVSDTYHSVTVVDPYRWLEKDGTPEVKQWTVAQNALTRRYLDAIPQRPAIAKRVAELLHSEPVQRY